MNTLVHLQSSTVSVVLSTHRNTVSLLYWGAALGALGNEQDFLAIADDGQSWGVVDEPVHPSFWREGADGFHGEPALAGHRGGKDWSPKFTLTKVTHQDQTLSVEAQDAQAGLSAQATFTLDGSGVLYVGQSITNTGSAPYTVDGLVTWLPLPDRVSEILDFTGRWIKERQPQRTPINVGTWTRAVREGRSGHEHTIVQLAMTEGTNFSQGEAWSVGLLWSGNGRYSVERTSMGRTAIGAGGLLLPGEVELAPGETFHAPSIGAAYSNEGFDGITDVYNSWFRSRPAHPTNIRPRPLTLNVWEAVWFDHRIERLTELMDVAQEIGVERFVLDDGWFHLRRDDHAGLGDWWVDPSVWPNGLGELIDRVKSRGMEFGLWFEPEMVNANSDLFREHPDWILHIGDRTPPEQRHQQVLNLANPQAFQHVFNQMNAILNEYDISYIKWDHNRVLVEPGYEGSPAVRKQTWAFYELVRALKAAHPGLEIESCASGGGRIDFGAAMECDRFWTSDCNEALERQHIQRWTGIAIPPEMLGTHIGPPKAHSTGRTHSLGFRATTALFGHAGLEWDITESTPEERIALREWADYYKANRDLLHGGKVVRADGIDESAYVHGVVTKDQSRAIYTYVQLTPAGAVKPSNFLLPGLDPERTYRVRRVEFGGTAGVLENPAPSWVIGVETTGKVLAELGLRPQRIYPENAFVIEVTAAP